MPRFLSLSLALLALAAPSAAAPARPSLRDVCAGRVLPFPVPDLSDVTDDAAQSWADGAWDAYCEAARPGTYEARACACRSVFFW